jgi:hypothetical protein
VVSQTEQHDLQRRDREAMLDFATAINAGVSKQLKRDACDDWCLFGTKGHVYALADHGQFYLFYSGSPYPYLEDSGGPRWAYAKKLLSFCRVHQDGDAEGFLRLDRLPTAAEGEIIRRVLGIHKRRPPPAHGFKSKPSQRAGLGEISAHLEQARETASDRLFKLLDLHDRGVALGDDEIDVARRNVMIARQALDQFDLTNNQRKA